MNASLHGLLFCTNVFTNWLSVAVLVATIPAKTATDSNRVKKLWLLDHAAFNTLTITNSTIRQKRHVAVHLLTRLA